MAQCGEAGRSQVGQPVHVVYAMIWADEVWQTNGALVETHHRFWTMDPESPREQLTIKALLPTCITFNTLVQHPHVSRCRTFGAPAQ